MTYKLDFFGIFWIVLIVVQLMDYAQATKNGRRD